MVGQHERVRPRLARRYVRLADHLADPLASMVITSSADKMAVRSAVMRRLELFCDANFFG
jgi:hypothetical protein